jgi:hypothetical protein
MRIGPVKGEEGAKGRPRVDGWNLSPNDAS